MFESKIRKIIELIEETTAITISASSLGDVENGIKMPQWNTLATIAAAGFVKHPKTQKILTADNFSDIAAEVLDPHLDPYETATTKKATSNWNSEIMKYNDTKYQKEYAERIS